MRLLIVILVLVGLVIVDQFKFRGYYGVQQLSSWQEPQIRHLTQANGRGSPIR